MEPGGGGEVLFSCPVVRRLKPVQLTSDGKVKRVRGVAYPILEESHAPKETCSLRLRDTVCGRGHKVQPDVYNFRMATCMAISSRAKLRQQIT